MTMIAIFAGGCFWCMEPVFDRLDGVISTTSGYTGGWVQNPTYQEVCEGKTGHLEAIKIVYDPAKIGYAKLLDLFWHHIDPLDPAGQFCDKGPQYMSAIFYTDPEQQRLADASKREVEHVLGEKVYTQVRPEEIFYPAEDYHQDFHNKSPGRYNAYASCCGRVERLFELWGDKSR